MHLSFQQVRGPRRQCGPWHKGTLQELCRTASHDQLDDGMAPSGRLVDRALALVIANGWYREQKLLYTWDGVQKLLYTWDSVQDLYTWDGVQELLYTWDGVQKLLYTWDGVQELLYTWDGVQKLLGTVY